MSTRIARPRLSIACPLAAVTVLVGCLGPRPLPPPEAKVTAPSAWRGSEAASTELNDEFWWRQFGDPTMNTLVERGLARNTDIGVSAARVAEARAKVLSAKAARLPEIDLSSAGGYSRTVTLGVPVTTPGGETQLGVAWDLDLFGRLAQADQAARADLLASRASHDAVRLSIAAGIAETYIRLLGADAKLGILRDTLASQAESLRVIRRLANAGYASRLDLYQAQGEYQATLASVPQAELAVTRLEDALSVLAGEPPSAVVRPAGGLGRLSSPLIPVGLPSSVLRRRPDVVAAEDNLVSADRSLDSARAAMLPNVSLSGSLGAIYAESLPHPLSLFDVGGSILAPLFDAGRRRAGADAAAARRDQAAFAYRSAVLTAFREVEDAIATERSAAERRGALSVAAQANASALTTSKRRYIAGYSSYLNQLDAQRQLLSTQLNQIDAQTDALIGAVQLYKVLGGGWPAVPDASDAKTRPTTPSDSQGKEGKKIS